MAVCAAQEAILFLQRLATLARSGYKGPVQQKWEATFLDMIHMLCTSNTLPQVFFSVLYSEQHKHLPVIHLSATITVLALTNCMQICMQHVAHRAETLLGCSSRA